MAEEYPFIVVEGNIGAGKTTFAQSVARQNNGYFLPEKFEDNPFLPSFYKEPDRYAFQVELTFLVERCQQIKQVQQPSLFHSFIISDFYFNKSLIFSSKTLKREEYDLYKRIYQIFNVSLPKPSLYIYLHQKIERLLAQIEKRGRDYEQDISAGYLKQVEEAYFSYFKEVADFPVVIVNADEYNFLNDEEIQSLYRIIRQTKFENGINYYPSNV
jgi:deoxyadenosine/deoxycytidine kinase